MEVTLKTEAEAGASGFSVKGGGDEGIFIKKVLKESPASKIFSLKEGDQLLSATIFFDNIKYEDALKILQYSEPYRVQFSLKRKIAVKEELEHSTTQYKKERISQEKELSESIPEETLHVSGKAISEEDRETLIASQRVGRSKRPKKDRLSWPKFQSIKNKKILRHRRSHSTSDAYEPAVQDISPTSTDTESQFPQEVHTKEKKGSQRKLKFPSIGFRMHRSKTDLQEKQKKEIKTTLISEREKIHEEDISLENPEILTVEYTTSPAYKMKIGEVQETLTKDLKDMKNGIPSHVKQCPEVEISIKKEKDKESTSKFSLPEVPDITTEIPKPSLETPDLKASPTEKTSQASSKSRKKKQKGTPVKKEGESEINIDLMSHTAKGSTQVKGLEIGTAKAELNISDTLEAGEIQVEEDTKILTIQKTKFGISVPKRKETETETTKLGGDVPHSEPEKTMDATSEDGRNLDVKTHIPDAEPEVSSWKIQMPSFKMTKTPKTDIKIARQESTGESEDTVKKEWIEDGIPTSDKTLKFEMKTGEKDIEGKESKFRLPKLKFPTFTWSNTKEETGKTEGQISEMEGKMPTLKEGAEAEICGSAEEIKVPSVEVKTEISKGKIKENDMKEKTKVQLPSPKKITIKPCKVENAFQKTTGEILMSTTDIEIKNGEEQSKIDMKAPKVDISVPSVDVTLPKASVDVQAPEATLSLEGEAKAPEKEAAKTKDGKFKMPKFGMPSFGWSSSREAKGSVAAEVDVSLKEPQVTVPSGAAEVDISLKEPHVTLPSGAAEVEVSLPGAEIQAPGVEVTLEATATGEGEKGRFKMPDIKMPDVKMPSVKLPKVKAPHAQVSLPKAEVSLPKGQEGEVALQGPEAEGGLEVAAGKVEGGGMKIHMPKVKVPSVVFSKPTVKAPKVEADVSLPQAELKAGAADVSIAAPDIKLPSVEGSLELQAPEIDLKAPSAEVSLDGTKLETSGLKGKLKMPKFDKPKFGVSSPKAEGPEVSLPSAEVELPSATVTAAGEGPGLSLKGDVPGAKTEGAGWKLEKPSLKMPKADIKAPKVDISVPSVDVTLPKASVDVQAPEATLSLEGEAKAPEKEAAKTKDGKFKMPKFGMPSFGWSSSREAKGSAAAEVDVSLKEPQVTVPSGAAEVDISLKEPHVTLPSGAAEVEVSLPGAEIQAPGVEVTLEATATGEGEKGRFKMPDIKMPDVKMPSVKLPKVKAPHAQVSLPKAEVSLPKGQEGEVALQGPEAEGGLEVAAGKVEGGGMKIHMPKVKVPSVVFSKPTVKAPKVEADVSLPQAELKASAADVSIAAPDIKLPSVEGSLELQAPEIDLKAPSAEVSLDGAKLEASGLKGKLKMPKFDKPKFGVSSPKAEGPEVSLPSAEVELPSATVTAAGEGPGLSLKGDVPGAKTEGAGWKLEKPSLKMPKADIKAPKVDISVPSVDVTLPKASVDVQVPEATLSLEGEAKAPEKEAAKTKDGKFKMPKFGMPSFGWSSSREAKGSVDVTLTKFQINLTESESKIPSLADENLSDFEIVNEDGSVEEEGLKSEVKTRAGEMSLADTDVTVKIPKFRKPKFGIRSKGKASESDIGFKVESEISRERITSDMTDPDTGKPTDISDVKLGVKLHKPSLEVVLDAPILDPNLSPMEVTMPKSEGEIHSTDLDCKADQEVISGEKDAEEKEKSKSSKFKLPSFRWSPKKEAIVPSQVEKHLEEPPLSTLSGDTDSELTFTTPENQYVHVELDTSIEKDGEKIRNKKSQFTMPKISFPKIKGQKVQVSLPVLETDICGPKQEKEGVSVQKSEKEISGEGAGMSIKMPKVTVPTLEFSKPEVKAPEIDMDISRPTGEVILSMCEEDDLKLKSAAANASLSTSEIAVSDVEIKAEGPEGKTKMSKFQMPKLGITLSKGKGPEKEVSQSKSEVKVPQLKATVEISDIVVEGPNLEVECGTGTETYSPQVKMTKTDSKASEADVHLPSADISIPKPDSDIQDSDAALKIKGEIKPDGDGEEKEGHFKMPKFKLPSFSWSPKKETSVKPDSGANLEDQKLAVMSSRIDTEVRGTGMDDEGSGTGLDLEISTGKVEQKSPIKKPQFVMPKISLSKIKVPKSQSHSSKVEVDATLLKMEREGDDSIQIPDIERSHSERTEEGAQISIKVADLKFHTLEFSKIETEASQNEMGISSAKIDAALTPSEGSFQQVDLKSSSTDECNIQKTDIKFPKGEASVELKSPDIVIERSSVVDGRKVKLEGPEGKIKMPKFQKPKFGISLTKGKFPEAEISSPKIEAEQPQLKIADIAVGVPASELISDISDPGVVVCKIKTPQDLTDGIEAQKVDISLQSVSKPRTEGAIESLEDKEIKLKEEHEIKAEEVRTEEHQGWFKMPKFRIPAFGRTSLKEKKCDADIESMEKAQASIPSAKVQTETSIPENTFSLPHAVAEITIGKEGIKKIEDSVRSSDVSLSKMEGDISLSTERTDSRVNIPKTETYADIVKRGAEGQKMHTSEFTVSAAELPKSYLSASETDKDNSLTNRFSTGTLTFQEHKVKPQDMEVPKVESSTKLETSGVGCKPSSAEITLDATQEKTDVRLPKEELDVQNKEAAIKKGKIKGEVKIIGKDSEESQLKRTMCEWSTTKGSEDGTYVTAKLEDLKVEVPGVKTNVKITRVDPEMKFQVKSVEKDVSAGMEVQVEDRAEISKTKAYKFKIPKFGMFHSEIKGFEGDSNVTKSEADSISKSEIDTAEMQLQKPEGSVGLKSPALDYMEASDRITGETVDQSESGPEVIVRIPRLKIPRFTFKTLPIEADVLVSKVATDPKGSSTDIEIVQLEASSAISDETPGALEGSIQKAKSKILMLTEPDIKTAQMTTTIESSLSNAGQDIHWSYIEGQEVSEKVEPEHVAIERCEIYTTEILKESEILSSKVKTATLGFSLLKAKLPESHSDLEVLVQQPSPTEGGSVKKSTCAGESFGVAAQRTGSAEPKLSDKPHHESEKFSGEISLPKLKTYAAEAKPSSKLEEGLPDKSPERITSGPLSKDEDVAEAVEGEEKDKTNEKEKADSKRSPGRFKFWLPGIGFSSSGDEASTDVKTEVKKSDPEDMKSADASDDFSKQTEKTGWFRFPKLGFTSPSKKAKSVEKEEMGHKEGRISDEDSPSDKPDVFFDAQESLSPKETTRDEKVEIDGASSIVTSLARTELILLEEEKDSKSNIDGDITK
ncbi:protein AHNAK2 isoform X2 [Manacus vitellinus]|uniref:protein AHNAK2 isoform X2 n=1 Tax=Manacus vitellinus TaxID=328815 RepID=UPI00115F244E|nr:protein AHNAK2 isoform X2 [Manacus vitellinus]